MTEILILKKILQTRSKDFSLFDQEHVPKVSIHEQLNLKLSKKY